WLPTLMAAAGNPNITDQLLKGVKLGDRTYKNHLDGYNQMDLLTGKGPSKRQELFSSAALSWARFASTTLSLRFSHSLGAGQAKRPPRTCPRWSTFVRIRSNARRVFAASRLTPAHPAT